jgi:hypothetical protein
MSAPLTSMDALRPIDFTDALRCLQAWIGTEVDVTINYDDGRFFGCGLAGRLDRVETFPPDNSAIEIVFQGDQSFFLDPRDVAAFAGPENDGHAAMLELRLSFGVSVTVEPSSP